MSQDSIKKGATLSLRENAERVWKRQKKMGVALVVILAAGSLGAYWPLHHKLERTRTALAQTEIELAANRDRASTLPQLMDAVDKLRRQVDQYKPLRGRSDIEDAMKLIGDINTKTRLVDYKYTMPEVKSHPSCSEQPITMTFQADFVDAMSFIQKLESMDRLTRLRSLSIKQKDATRGGNVTVSMALSLFFSNTSEAGK